MPNIQVGDQVIAFPDNMNPDELNKAVKSSYDQISQSSQPSNPNSLISNVLNGAFPGTNPQQGQLPSAVNSVINNPVARGMGGLSVGAENLIRPYESNMLIPGSSPTSQQVLQSIQNAPNALSRAAAATQPGFQPQDLRENIANQMGVQGANSAMLGGIGEAAAPVINPVTSKIGQTLSAIKNRALQGQATEQIAGLKSQLRQVPIQLQDAQNAGAIQQKALGSNVGAVRDAAGVPQELDVEPPTAGEKIQATQLYKKISKADPAVLAKEMGKDGVAHFKDLADKLLNEGGLSKMQRGVVQAGLNNIYKAMEPAGIPEVAGAYKAVGQSAQDVEQLPLDAMKQKAALQDQIDALRPKAQLEQRTRLGAGLTAGGGLGYAGLYALKKLAGLGR